MFYFIIYSSQICFFFFFNDTATTEIYTLSLHDALPISPYYQPVPPRPSYERLRANSAAPIIPASGHSFDRSEEHTSELQSQSNLVCRLLLEKKKKNIKQSTLIYLLDMISIHGSRRSHLH